MKTKKKYFEKFIEGLEFVELSTQVKHLGVCVLHDDSLNDNPRHYCIFEIETCYFGGNMKVLLEHLYTR